MPLSKTRYFHKLPMQCVIQKGSSSGASIPAFPAKGAGGDSAPSCQGRYQGRYQGRCQGRSRSSDARHSGECEDGNVIFLAEAMGDGRDLCGGLRADGQGSVETEELLSLRVAGFEYAVRE